MSRGKGALVGPDSTQPAATAREPASRARFSPLGRLYFPFPVVLLLLVALGQLVMAETAGLTPWKGGGFGMFSTLDGRDNRRVFVQLVRDDAGQETRYPAAMPRDHRLRLLQRRVQALPSQPRLQAFARELAELPWRVDDRLDPANPKKARVIQERHERDGTHSARFHRVEVTIWKLEASVPSEQAIALRPSFVASASAPNPRRPLASNTVRR